MTAKPRNGVVAYGAVALAIVAAIGAQVVLAINAWKTSAKVETVAEVVVAVKEKAEVADTKLDKIGKDTDGNFSKANERIEKLEKMLEERFKPDTKKP